MGAAEIEEIAEVMTSALRATTPVVTNGTPSMAKYVIEPQAEAEARSRMAALCQEFPVYPEIDLSIVDPRDVTRPETSA
jgi:glycine/serine hydroxymethyltransferase